MGAQLDKEQREELNQFVQKFKLTEEDSQYYVDTFKNYCRSGKTAMSRADFREFLKMMHISYNDVLIATVYSILDTNADGELEVVEFIRYFILLTRYPLATKAQIVFDIIDRDGSGTIELAELHGFYNSLHCARRQLVHADLPVCRGKEDPVTAENIDVDAVFKEIDADGNRHIDRKEWAAQADKHGQKLLRMLDAYLVTEDDRRYSVETFRKFCRFNKHTMSREDFKDFLAMMNRTDYTELLISTVFQVLDTNADGELAAVEFMRYFLLLTRFPVDSKVLIAFDIIDRDASGAIELVELRRFYQDLVGSRAQLVGARRQRELLADGDVDRLFDHMDLDSNKKVEPKEFEQHARATGPQLLQLLDAYLGD